MDPRLCKLPRSRAQTARQSGRGRRELSAFSYQLSAISYQLSAFSYQHLKRLRRLGAARTFLGPPAVQDPPEPGSNGTPSIRSRFRRELSAISPSSAFGARHCRTFHGPPAVQAPPEPGPNGTPSIRSRLRRELSAISPSSAFGAWRRPHFPWTPGCASSAGAGPKRHPVNPGIATLSHLPAIVAKPKHAPPNCLYYAGFLTSIPAMRSMKVTIAE
jgi:hypothetical protein